MKISKFALGLLFALVIFLVSSILTAAVPAPANVAAPPEEAERTASGLASLVLVEGTGNVHPSKMAIVEVHYTGWTTDGEMFDSSVARGKKSSLPLNRVIAGWTEGVQLMVVGEKRRLWIPEELAYAGKADRPAGMLVFDIELFGFQEPIPPPQVPVDVAEPPLDAVFTRSRLASKVLEAGTGTEHPTKKSNVTVHYSGWTTDGRMFDSSVVRGKPATFPLNRVIAGWTEGLQLMVKGESRRFWIPQKLAYKGQPPKGMLVFDVTLLDFN
ncbi:MAG: FKBP-type peptidylprolyl isomerase, partial [Acidimicrobiia bacterium]|nr:FKBP-type peptidylprolyl isomerase [Acidimicrobiia bacterium]